MWLFNSLCKESHSTELTELDRMHSGHGTAPTHLKVRNLSANDISFINNLLADRRELAQDPSITGAVWPLELDQRYG